jgi:hypothetical protein
VIYLAVLLKLKKTRKMMQPTQLMITREVTKMRIPKTLMDSIVMRIRSKHYSMKRE